MQVEHLQPSIVDNLSLLFDTQSTDEQLVGGTATTLNGCDKANYKILL